MQDSVTGKCSADARSVAAPSLPPRSSPAARARPVIYPLICAAGRRSPHRHTATSDLLIIHFLLHHAIFIAWTDTSLSFLFVILSRHKNRISLKEFFLRCPWTGNENFHSEASILTTLVHLEWYFPRRYLRNHCVVAEEWHVSPQFFGLGVSSLRFRLSTTSVQELCLFVMVKIVSFFLQTCVRICTLLVEILFISNFLFANTEN